MRTHIVVSLESDSGLGCRQAYYQYEYTYSSTMEAAGLPETDGRWMHKCQLLAPFPAGCGSPFAEDSNDFDEYAGRVSSACECINM